MYCLALVCKLVEQTSQVRDVLQMIWRYHFYAFMVSFGGVDLLWLAFFSCGVGYTEYVG